MKALISFVISLFSVTGLVSPLSHVITPVIIPTPTQIVTVGLVGDLGLGRHITSTARSKNDFSWSFQKISPWLLQNDFTLANLESPVIADCPPGYTGTFIFCGDTRFIPQLSPFILNLNNNHILNYGQSGLAQTQKYLPENSFYNNFLVKKVNGISFGFLGFDFITNPKLDKTEVINKIKTYAPQVDWLIVSVHWGNEYLPNPELWRIDLAHQMVDAGADIIHGQHPHVYQPLEIYKDKYIFYSLGNFIFDQSWSYATSHSQIVRLILSKDKILSEELFPIEIKFNSQPALMP
ncbi:MAG: CapA family protein, partial [Candidatus Shapirobacteria bacterium]|nr:CapA family protein [Candidatus Shapirobacteria bacterium]